MFKSSRRLLATLLVLSLPVVMGACSKKTETNMQSESVKVTSVDLGKGIGADNRVTDKADTFGPNDVIYAAVITDGASPNAVLRTTWMFQDGQVVAQSERVIAPNGETATEFHIEKPDGLPPGKYKVVVSLDGNPVQTKEFEVKAS
jgi:hypothetical protein